MYHASLINSHRQKRMKQMKQKRKQGKVDINEDDPFELFILSTSIRYCYYAETHKILGNTFGMCILQVNLYFLKFHHNTSQYKLVFVS